MEIIKKNENDVLLVDIQSIEPQHISRILSEAGYNAIYINKDEYKKQSTAGLIIVDVKTHGYGAITDLKKEQQDCSPQSEHQPEQHPPLLAIVDVLENNLSAIFQLGAVDYISCPFIIAEFKNRVKLALQPKNSVQTFIQRLNAPVDEYINVNVPTEVETVKQIDFEQADFILVYKAARYLKTQLASDIKLKDLLRKLGTNKNKLRKAFKSCFGTSVFIWLTEQRLKHAAQLLATTSQSIGKISEQVGYPNSDNFSTAFKRLYLLTPSKYRQSILNKVLLAKGVVL